MPARPPVSPANHFLPELLPGERELMRLIVARGFAAGHLSLRTRRDPAAGGWHHRLVDEHGGRWRLRPARTLQPLSATSAARLLDSAATAEGPFSNGDPVGTIWAALRLDEVPGAIRLCSQPFPELARALLQRERAYLAEWGAPPIRVALRPASEPRRLRA